MTSPRVRKSEDEALAHLLERVRKCTLCASRFSETASKHSPRPVLRASQTAKICIAGQAPGIRVHESGLPFTDPSGERLREWLETPEDVFYDIDQIAILPMAFCFPGHDSKRSDLPPPPICAQTWRSQLFSAMRQFELILLIGKAAQDWHLNDKNSMTERVRRWTFSDNDIRTPEMIPLPHPSWRNNTWLKKNPWFETDTLPKMREALRPLLS